MSPTKVMRASPIDTSIIRKYPYANRVSASVQDDVSHIATTSRQHAVSGGAAGVIAGMVTVHSTHKV